MRTSVNPTVQRVFEAETSRLLRERQGKPVAAFRTMEFT